MKKNMGTVDRIIRVFVALVLFALYITGVIKDILGIILLVVAAVFLLTAIFRFCPLYTLFGLHTLRCKVGNDD